MLDPVVQGPEETAKLVRCPASSLPSAQGRPLKGVWKAEPGPVSQGKRKGPDKRGKGS